MSYPCSFVKKKVESKGKKFNMLCFGVRYIPYMRYALCLDLVGNGL
jgi:hypothetical protein